MSAAFSICGAPGIILFPFADVDAGKNETGTRKPSLIGSIDDEWSDAGRLLAGV
jgi:hypothetical protein